MAAGLGLEVGEESIKKFISTVRASLIVKVQVSVTVLVASVFNSVLYADVKVGPEIHVRCQGWP